jgi:hypothetical protein
MEKTHSMSKIYQATTKPIYSNPEPTTKPIYSNPEATKKPNYILII